MKYLPQRPVELHEIAASPPPAAPSPKATPRRRPAPPATGASSLQGRPKSAAAATTGAARSTAAATASGQAQGPDAKTHHVRISTAEGKADNREGLDQQASTRSATAPTASDSKRPHSSSSAHGGPSSENKEGGRTGPASARSFIPSPTRNTRAAGTALRGKSAPVGVGRPEKPRLRRPQTADGRDVEVTRHKTPFLDDPADPVMIAHRCA